MGRSEDNAIDVVYGSDLSTSITRVRIDPRAIRDAYLESINRHIEFLSRTAMAFNFDYQRLSTHESVGPAMAYLLARRHAQLSRSKYG